MKSYLHPYLAGKTALALRYGWVVPLLTVLVWANWQAPEMHHFVQPAEIVVWQLAPLNDPAAARKLATDLATVPGVSACAVSSTTNCVAFVYHPTAVVPATLYQAVGQRGGRIVNTLPTQAPKPAIRQCPVPTSYLVLLDQVRFALNFRRFSTSEQLAYSSKQTTPYQ